jgi:capsular exopolysaccharide synthesis family protein
MDTERRESAVLADGEKAPDNRILVRLPELPYSAEEALNRLRVNVKFSGKHTRKILVTSSVPNEGKSHMAVYLWKMLAEAGHRTVLVDADLRKSVLKGIMELPKNQEVHGLSYYLSGLAEYEDVVHQTTIDNADVVPCVNLLQNPSSLLEDPRLKELMDRLGEDYDYVIVDTPPLVSVSDGALIAALCDGAVLVVRSGETPRTLIRQSLAQLGRTNCRILGTVLNGVSTGKRGYYGRYYSGYYYSRYYRYYTEYYTDSDTGEKKKVKKKSKHHKKS